MTKLKLVSKYCYQCFDQSLLGLQPKHDLRSLIGLQYKDVMTINNKVNAITEVRIAYTWLSVQTRTKTITPRKDWPSYIQYWSSYDISWQAIYAAEQLLGLRRNQNGTTISRKLIFPDRSRLTFLNHFNPIRYPFGWKHCCIYHRDELPINGPPLRIREIYPPPYNDIKFEQFYWA